MLTGNLGGGLPVGNQGALVGQVCSAMISVRVWVNLRFSCRATRAAGCLLATRMQDSCWQPEWWGAGRPVWTDRVDGADRDDEADNADRANRVDKAERTGRAD